MDSVQDRASGVEPLAVLAQFRRDLHQCLTARGDELFELADAVLCADGPVRALAGLSLAAVHRRGHGALYDAVSCGQITAGPLRRSLTGPPLPVTVNIARWRARFRCRTLDPVRDAAGSHTAHSPLGP
jgi:hypothetical protein